MTDPRDALQDELLVLAARNGGRAPFEALVGRWQERLWRHAYRLTGNRDAAWDVLQDSWIAIGRGLQRLEDPARFRAWAYQVVTRRVADRGRREGRAPVVPLPELEPPAPVPDSGRELVLDRLRRALRELDPERRSLLGLRYVDGLECAEIARALDIPVGTVRSRLFHARGKLREILERMENE
jgi:RNA polymerase sigma factor (sigma-70 family)